MRLKDLIYGFNDKLTNIYCYDSYEDINHKIEINDEKYSEKFLNRFGDRNIIDWSYTRSNNSVYVEI